MVSVLLIMQPSGCEDSISPSDLLLSSVKEVLNGSRWSSVTDILYICLIYYRVNPKTSQKSVSLYVFMHIYCLCHCVSDMDAYSVIACVRACVCVQYVSIYICGIWMIHQVSVLGLCSWSSFTSTWQPTLIFYWCSFKKCELLSDIFNALYALASLHIKIEDWGDRWASQIVILSIFSTNSLHYILNNLLKRAVLFMQPLITSK